MKEFDLRDLTEEEKKVAMDPDAYVVMRRPNDPAPVAEEGCSVEFIGCSCVFCTPGA